jgi:5-oxoprolinase (ATP-hydrolysing)
MTGSEWEFWIDVGGTFTDCFAKRPDGVLVRHKLLSSGVTKGTAATGSGAGRIVDPARRADPPDFWTGWSIVLVDELGRTAGQTRAIAFDAATGTLALEAGDQIIGPGQRYELTPDEPAPVVAIRYLLGLSRADRIPPVIVKLGTTRATNALITRGGSPTGLITTRGFGDVLAIGYQNRPGLFDLTIRKPAPLVCQSVEIDERISSTGEVLHAPDSTAIERQLAEVKSQGIHALAICLLHSVVNPVHEMLIGAVAKRLGFAEISLSHQVAPLVKIVARGDTTAANAYLNPVLAGYLKTLESLLPGSDLKVLTSAGGLVSAPSLTAKDAILSGPAGGVVGFSRIAQAAGFQRAIGFDMGGTSTDVARFDGRWEQEFETEKSGVRIVAPMIAIDTVAAGGGSICAFDGAKLIVGPKSAGADPGPACYGRGGPLTITDCNCFLGRVQTDRFPFPLDLTAVELRLRTIASEIESSSGRRYELAALADGLVRVANATMARAIRGVSTAKGYDVRDYALVAFGGAGPQHACAVARELGVRTVLCHADAGLLSAYGIGLADVVRNRVRGIYQRLDEKSLAICGEIFAELSDSAAEEIRSERVASEIAIRRTLQLRYEGVEASISIDESSCPSSAGQWEQAFLREHRRLYGYVQYGRAIEIVSAHVEATGRVAPPLPTSTALEPRQIHASRERKVYLDGQWRRTACHDAADLAPGDRIEGAAIIAATTATIVVEHGWQADVLSHNEIVLTDCQGAVAASEQMADDPATLEIFNHLFAGIAEQMGHTLRSTATSVNVKERLDYSCALFDDLGRLIATAAHIPVHLGAMALTVRNLIDERCEILPGDVFITNDPFRGGSHLPDVTVITPVHDGEGELRFFTANRAHHAEIGGIMPGSMPPFSKNLAEEGVLILLTKLVDAGESRFDLLRNLLSSSPYPSRDVPTNLADISAQVAANSRGAAELLALVERYSLAVVDSQMEQIRRAATHKVSRALAAIPDGEYRRVDQLDDGSPIAVSVSVRGARAVIDFTGTAPVLGSNLNANRAIVTAAVLYVLRCLIGEDVPLNEGMLEPVEIVLSECLLNPPRRESPELCAAVAAGNVETSQRVVDVLLGALGLAAASQGTMNNLLFGDATFGYYETICGGAGATADGPGADAVQTHMTNTRLTDPEVLERRYPVRVREFSIRRGSGGAGEQRGGDGVRRELEFLQPLELSIVSQRRGAFAPYGMQGGHPGAIGKNTLIRADGAIVDLGGTAQRRVGANDRIIIETPGGGGWGSS